MRVVCTEISSDGANGAVVRFNTTQEDSDKPEKGMCQIALPLDKARMYSIGDAYELMPPHVRPKVVKLATKGKK